MATGEATVDTRILHASGFSCASSPGSAPRNYALALDGRGIECDIRKQDPGGILKIAHVAGGTRSVQRSGGGESMVNVSHENDGVSSSTHS